MRQYLCIPFLLLISLLHSTVSNCQSTVETTSGTAIPKQSLMPHSPEAEAIGKFGDLPVGLNTGTPKVTVPIYDLKLKRVTVPVSLDYHASGVKVDELATNVGLDWALNAGGT